LFSCSKVFRLPYPLLNHVFWWGTFRSIRFALTFGIKFIPSQWA
jgi:hypothetical protein